MPDDLSILGFDDIPSAEQSLPPLSTIELPVEEIAERAIAALTAQIADPLIGLDPCIYTVRTHLVRRGSVAVPRGA